MKRLTYILIALSALLAVLALVQFYFQVWYPRLDGHGYQTNDWGDSGGITLLLAVGCGALAFIVECRWYDEQAEEITRLRTEAYEWQIDEADMQYNLDNAKQAIANLEKQVRTKQERIEQLTRSSDI